LSTAKDLPLCFRSAIASDVPAIAALVQAAFRGDESRQGWTTEADFLNGERISAQAITALIADPKTRVVLCYRQGALVGTAKLVVHNEHCSFGLFAVQPTLQAAGLGKALLAECERVARAELSCLEMRMQVISIREELLAFYERRGYRRTGEYSPFPYDEVRPGDARRLDLRFELLTKTLTLAPEGPR
jgi:ribosomal protein S18 acetylase RimI-like enzyme